MGLASWWRQSRERAAATSRSLAINSDQEIIATQVPELTCMRDVEGMAYVLRQIEGWNKSCSPEEAATFTQRLQASNEAWQADGLTMPYWGNLWVLRNYQRQLGHDVPSVALPAGEAFKVGEAAGKYAMTVLDRFIELEIVPRRRAFIDVFQGQLDTLDERLAKFDATGRASREELAGIDYRILLNNWRERRGEQSEQAANWLSVQLEQAEAIDCGEDVRTVIDQALDHQQTMLTIDGLEMLLKVVPDYDNAHPI